MAFFAFFYVLCKRTLRSLRSFTFLRKERIRTHPTFGFHKSPKTQKKNAKKVVCFKRTQKNDAFRFQNVKERGAQPCLLYSMESNTLRSVIPRGGGLYAVLLSAFFSIPRCVSQHGVIYFVIISTQK